MTNTLTVNQYFKVRGELRYKYFDQPNALQFTTIPQFGIKGYAYVADNLSDLYFFHYYLNPKSQNTQSSQLLTKLEQTIQKIINREIEQPPINFQNIYIYLEKLPSKIESANAYFDRTANILNNQQVIKTLFAKYKDALLSLNQISNNQQLWI